MTDEEIAPLPEPRLRFEKDTTCVVLGEQPKQYRYFKGDPIYTADQMREYARSLLAAQAKQAGQTEPMEHGQARQVLDVGFKFENGVHTPTVLVGFAVNDWNARDAFAAALALPAPIEQITPENTDPTINAELLDACKGAVRWLEGWASAEPYLSILNEAIAKAEGTAGVKGAWEHQCGKRPPTAPKTVLPITDDCPKCYLTVHTVAAVSGVRVDAPRPVKAADFECVKQAGRVTHKQFEHYRKVMGEHDLYTDADADRPDVICDRNGQVALGLCKVCGRGEAELDGPCPGPRGVPASGKTSDGGAP